LPSFPKQNKSLLQAQQVRGGIREQNRPGGQFPSSLPHRLTSSLGIGLQICTPLACHFLWNPYILTQFVGFFLFLVAAQAELTQTPFDMPVAESELVAGYMVEYTGFRFLFFFMGEFGTAFAFAGIAATLFLGGWSIPHVHGTLADVFGPIVLFTKIMIVSFLIFWARFTYPRFREDQLQAIAWKYLIPLSLVNILATGVFKVVF